MIYISCIILGTVGILLSLIYAYEWSGADPYVFNFVVAYTLSIATLHHGLYHTRKVIRRK